MTTREYLEYYKKFYEKQKGQEYPCSNQTVRKILYCLKEDEKVLNYIKSLGGVYNKRSYDRSTFVLPNGEEYIILKPSNNTRGYRAYKTIIDDRLPIENIQCFVLPYCSFYCCSLEIF